MRSVCGRGRSTNSHVPNSQAVDPNSIVKRCTERENAVYIHNGILFSHEMLAFELM